MAPASTLRRACLAAPHGTQVVLPTASKRVNLLQAHYINNRSMEVFRGMAAPGQPSVAALVAEQAPPLDLWRKFLYCESMSGPIYGEVDHFKARPQVGCGLRLDDKIRSGATRRFCSVQGKAS